MTLHRAGMIGAIVTHAFSMGNFCAYIMKHGSMLLVALNIVIAVLTIFIKIIEVTSRYKSNDSTGGSRKRD